MSAVFLSAATWGKVQIMNFLKKFLAEQDDGDFKFDCDESATQIMVLSKSETNYETINATPVCSVDEQSVNPENKVIGFLTDHDFKTGMKTFTDSYRQNITISCISTVPAEAHKVADRIFNGLKFNVRLIMNAGFQEVLPAVIGSQQTVEGSSRTDIVSVPVSVGVSYNIKWTEIDKEPILLSGIDVTFSES